MSKKGKGNPNFTLDDWNKIPEELIRETVIKEGKHIINLMYPIENLKDNTTYFIEVYLKCLNGQVTIDKNDIYCNIQGERLIKPVLNGSIPLPNDNGKPIG